MIRRGLTKVALLVAVVAGPWLLVGCGEGTTTTTMPSNPPPPQTDAKGNPMPPPTAAGAK